MSTIKYDKSVFSMMVLPKVDNARNYFNQAKNAASNFSCPKDFNYYSLVMETESRIQDVLSNLEKFKDWAREVDNQYEQLRNSQEVALKRIGDVEIKRRSQIVR